MKNRVVSVAICIASITVIASSQTAVLAQDGARAMPARSIDLGKLDPAPKTVVWLRGRFQLTDATQIMYTVVEAKPEAESLANKLRPATGFTLSVAPPPAADTGIDGVLLELEPRASNFGAVCFAMQVGKSHVRIMAGTPAGLSNGCKYLLQLLPPAILKQTKQENVDWEIPCCKLFDMPKDGDKSAGMKDK